MFVTVDSKADCCASLITDIIMPEEIQHISPETELLEQVSHEIIGTNKYRNGRRPTPEVQVTIREVIRKALDRGEPIPILIPFGASKQGPYNVDLAELMAAAQIDCLQRRVTQFYSPGCDFRIRLEDATDEILFGSEWVEQKTLKYIHCFNHMMRLACPYVTVLRESNMVDFSGTDFRRIQEILFRAIHGGEVGLLTSIGWVNGLPLEQLVYYRRVYDNFYVGMSRVEVDRLLSKFFACAIMRRMQGGTGELRPSIILYFGNPVPGVDQARRVYYRSNTKQHTHRAPWLGKGYIDMQHDVPYISGWNGDGNVYEENTVTLNQELELEADYVSSDW